MARVTKKRTEPIPKTKMKPRGGNSPVIGMNGYNLAPGDNTKVVSVSIALINMKNIDMHDVNQVAQRLDEYFELHAKADMKPTVAGLALALNGHNRTWLLNLVNDTPTGSAGYLADVSPEVASLIKKVYASMEAQWESYMASGKLVPVTGIFLAKNNFKYKDQTEHVLTPNRPNDSDIDPNSIKERYLLEAKEDEEKGSDS